MGKYPPPLFRPSALEPLSSLPYPAAHFRLAVEYAALGSNTLPNPDSGDAPSDPKSHVEPESSIETTGNPSRFLANGDFSPGNDTALMNALRALTRHCALHAITDATTAESLLATTALKGDEREALGGALAGVAGEGVRIAPRWLIEKHARGGGGSNGVREGGVLPRVSSAGRLVDMDWEVDVMSSSSELGEMAVPVCAVSLEKEGGEVVRVEMEREALRAMINGLSKIRDQLSGIN